MFMESKQAELQWQLKMLHEMLEDTEHVDDATRAKMKELAQEMERLLEAEAHKDEWSGFGERWRNAMINFETRHPNLSQAVEEVTGILASAGI